MYRGGYFQFRNKTTLMPVTYEDALSLYQQGRKDEAARACRDLSDQRMATADSYNLLGVILLESGDAESAAAAFADGLKCDLQQPMLLNNLGNALTRLGHFAEAETSYRQALQINSNLLAPWLGLCGLFVESARLAEARHLIDQLAPLAPQNPDILLCQASVLIAEGELPQAVAALEQVIQLVPTMVPALVKLAGIRLQLRDPVAAADLFGRALRFDPVNEQALSGLGDAMALMDRAAETLDTVEQAARLAPGNSRIAFILATTADQARQPERAAAAFNRVLALRPSDAALRIACGEHEFKMGRLDHAERLYEAALAIDPGQVKARLLLCVQQLPVAYRTEAEIDDRRAAFSRRLDELEDWVASADQAARARMAAILGEAMPFLLAAQGRNDRDLLARYGDFVTKVLIDAQPPIAGATAHDGPIRLGIVTGFFRQHAVWKIAIQGFMTELDPARVQLFCYSTQLEADAETAVARAHAARFVEGQYSRDRWVQEILSDRLDALLYPDYYMDRTTAQLAPLRLAPVQLAIGIHPVTTGLPSIDYHLTSDGMEPANAEGHYTETLVRLPNLANCYSFPAIARQHVTRAEIGVPDDAVMYWCGQSLHKLLPRDDRLFGEIAARVGNAFFVFVEHAPGHAANDIVRARLEAVLGPQGTRFVMLPKMPIGRFQAVTELADVFLDATAWSGNNTAMESLTAGLPIVTLPGDIMRARHCFAILTMLGVTDTIATSREDYVEIATRLGLDPAWRAEIGKRMLANRHKVLNDLTCVRALEDFLERVCR